MNDLSFNSQASPEEDAEFSLFLNESMSQVEISLSPDRRAAVLSAFEKVGTKSKKPTGVKTKLVAAWVGSAAAIAAALVLVLHRNGSGPPSSQILSVKEDEVHHGESKTSLDLANYDLAVMNSQLAAIERRAAWLQAASNLQDSK